MIVNTYLPLPAWLTATLVYLAKKGLVLTLFLIGAGLSVKMIKKCGCEAFCPRCDAVDCDRREQLYSGDGDY